MNILLLSAGGPACHGVIKSLKDINFDGKVVSVDCNELSAGFHLSDSYYIVPTAFDENYITELLKIVSKEKIDVIFECGSRDAIDSLKMYDFYQPKKIFCFECNPESVNVCRVEPESFAPFSGTTLQITFWTILLFNLEPPDNSIK